MANVVYKNVTKRFDEIVAVDNVSLEIRDSEFVVLVGPSGCGKSTTLRMVAGLEDITEGEIYIGDKLVNKLVPKERNVAMVFQNYALYPHMNVAENMAFGLKMRKVTTKEREKRVLAAAETLGIEDLLKRKPRQLSGGQRQRVALGRAIVRDPAVFLFDEPLSNLDAKLRVQMRTELKKLHERINTTSIYVTHDQVEAMTMGERIVVMKDGLVQQVGPPLELYNHPDNQFVASFIGSPAMNFIPCSVVEEKGALCIEFDGFRLPIPKEKRQELEKKDYRDFIFGLRPEDLGEYKEGDDPDIILEAMVEVIEPLGKEIQMNITVGRHDLNIILPADNKAKHHQKIKLVPNLNKGHLFLKSNGEAIY